MSNLAVIVFDDMDTAEKVRKSLQQGGMVSLDDSAVVVKDAEGKIHVRNQMDRGVKVGAVAGGVLGLLLTGIFFPLGGLVLGALGGAAVGAMADLGIEKGFVKQVGDDLKDGSSALFLIVRQADPNYALGVLRNYEGHVYHTTFDPETEERIRDAIKDKGSHEDMSVE